MIPRRFFYALDVTVILAAFATAYVLVPLVHPLLLGPHGLLRTPTIDALFAPAVSTGRLPTVHSLLWILLVVGVAILTIQTAVGNCEPLINRSRTRVVAACFLATLGGLSLASLTLVTLNGPYWSRLFAFLFALTTAVGLSSCRLGLRDYCTWRRAAGRYTRHVLLVGADAPLEWLSRHFAERVHPNEYRVFGHVHVNTSSAPVPGATSEFASVLSSTVHHPETHPTEWRREVVDSTSSVPTLLGPVSQVGELLVHCPIHDVVVAYPSSGGGWLQQIVKDCDYFRVRLLIVPEVLLFGELRDLHVRYRSEQLGLPAIVLAPPYWDSAAVFGKRVLDIAASGALLLILSPVFLAIAVAIKLTTPELPVLYPWRVVGQNGKRFTGYKFTTMVADADQRRAELASLNEMIGPVFKIRNDPRVTPLGRFLRKYSLNELPQLWSVLKGDMSLVGPRPVWPHELERFEFWHKRKLSIRPGITCLWQVRGRNRIRDFDDWVRMDLEYIESWSLWLDLKILVRTAWAVLAGTGS